MRFKVVSVLMLSAFWACDQPNCPASQENLILASNTPEQAVYQQELRRLVDLNAAQTRYFFESRSSRDGQDFLALNCYGPDFCGRLYVVLDGEDTQSLKLQNNAGWRGAELKGLRLRATEAGQLAYAGLERLVD
ncbi:MAG: hypothetical protein J0L99_20940 [Chitinophagales bacterium]|nr:hypothetical protein [Chitinophagales bacterium]